MRRLRGDRGFGGLEWGLVECGDEAVTLDVDTVADLQAVARRAAQDAAPTA